MCENEECTSVTICKHGHEAAISKLQTKNPLKQIDKFKTHNNTNHTNHTNHTKY